MLVLSYAALVRFWTVPVLFLYICVLLVGAVPVLFWSLPVLLFCALFVLFRALSVLVLYAELVLLFYAVVYLWYLLWASHGLFCAVIGAVLRCACVLFGYTCTFLLRYARLCCFPAPSLFCFAIL